jgi:hypothetical protein
VIAVSCPALFAWDEADHFGHRALTARAATINTLWIQERSKMASSSDKFDRPDSGGPRRIPLSEPLPIDGLRSLARLQLPAKQLMGELVGAGQGTGDLLVAWVEFPSAGDMRLYVVDPSGGHAYQVDQHAIPGGIRGFLLIETIGDCAIAPSLMLHNPLARPNGEPMPTHRAEVDHALKPRPTSESVVTRVVQEIIDAALLRNEPLTNAQAIDAILKHPSVHDWSKTRILTIYKRLEPRSWCKPGPKTKARG